MQYTLKDIYNSLTPEKRKSDGTMTSFLYRPISYLASWLFLRLHITPNSVTYISGASCIAAFILALFPIVTFHRIAIGLFLLFAVLDCADGNMARTLKKKTVYGGWVDAAGGYLAYATLLFSMGLSAFFRNQDSFIIPCTGTEITNLPWGSATWILLGAFAALANSLMRLNHQAFKNAELLSGKTILPGKSKRFSEEIGITGYLPLLYLAGFETGYLPAVLAVYTLIYAGGFALSTLKLIIKVEKAG